MIDPKIGRARNAQQDADVAREIARKIIARVTVEHTGFDKPTECDVCITEIARELAAAEQRGRDAEREACARRVEAGEFGEPISYVQPAKRKLIAAAIRARTAPQPVAPQGEAGEG